jgi:hypothetical protein
MRLPNMRTRRLKKRVTREKARRAAMGLSYQESPRVSLLVQSFNHVQNIPLLAERLHSLADCELIVCEDGSIDGSLEAWDRALDRPNDFMIRSNDLHEIRAYDRAAGLARGELICLLQDDDLPPADQGWFEQALALFERFPDLVVLGGFMAFSDLASENHAPHGPFPGDLTSPYREIPAHSAPCGAPFMFVEGINVGPVFLRRERFMGEIGGFDFEYAPVGWPGIHFDVEMSLRTWMRGGQVGWYQSGFEQAGQRGTESMGNLPKRLSQLEKNHGLLLRDYQEALPEIQERVRNANREINEQVERGG